MIPFYLSDSSKTRSSCSSLKYKLSLQLVRAPSSVAIPILTGLLRSQSSQNELQEHNLVLTLSLANAGIPIRYPTRPSYQPFSALALFLVQTVTITTLSLG